MDYESMSDFEINTMVTSVVFECDGWECNDAELYHCGVDGSDYYSQPILHYCNNPADAWSIIIKSEITIINLGDECMAVHGFQLIDDEYRDCIADWSLEARSKNPLRAAMIVFLMMNKGE